MKLLIFIFSWFPQDAISVNARIETIYHDKTIVLYKDVSVSFDGYNETVYLDGIIFHIEEEIKPLNKAVLAWRLKNIETGTIHLMNYYLIKDDVLIIVTTERGVYPNLVIKWQRKKSK